MRKLNPNKNTKISGQNSQKMNAEKSPQKITQNGTKNFSKNQELTQDEKQSLELLTKNSEYVPKIRGNSRTMEWLKIPLKVQKEFKQNLIAMEVDFMQYTCYKISEPLRLLTEILGFTGEIDDDNSNIEFNHNYYLSLVRRRTDKGYAYAITYNPVGIRALDIISIEVYNESKVQMLKTEGKIVFYGGYFVFRELLAEDAPEVLRFHNAIEIGKTLQITQQKNKNFEKVEKPIYKITRIDIATDVGVEISKKWLTKYIQPHKNSKHVPKPYSYDPQKEMFQSIGYIPRLTQGIGIRVYNKVKNIRDINKQAWHPTYGTEENPVVTRLELVYAGDFAQNSIEELIEYTKYRLLGDVTTKLKRKIRPKSQYSPLNAFNHFKKYAKNHGKELREILDDVWQLSLQEENKDKFEAIEIYSNNL